MLDTPRPGRITLQKVGVAAPPAPLDLEVTAFDDNSVTLSWTAPPVTGITDYRVQVKRSDSSIWTTFSDGVGTSTGAVVTGLLPGTSYDFRVATVTTVRGPYTAPVTQVTSGTLERDGLFVYLYGNLFGKLFGRN